MELLEIGKSFQRARKRSGYATAEEAANAIGISRPHLSSLENGHKQPSFDVLLRMSEVYGCELGDLFPSRTPRMNDFEPLVAAMAGLDNHERRRVIAQIAALTRSLLLVGTQADYKNSETLPNVRPYTTEIHDALTQQGDSARGEQRYGPPRERSEQGAEAEE